MILFRCHLFWVCVMRGDPPIAAIYNRANADPPTGEDADLRNAALYARIWRKLGLVVIDPTKISEQDWPMRQWVERMANEQYGKRGR